ncbi:MAG: 50S ribosomal protein L5 [Candidatus Ancaeobacter aquaticus]|nr:50S ribosomal protein L5 [Candidatus Ancaeobacter aquaticus]
MARLHKKYKEEIALKMKEKFEYKTVYQVPRLDKIVINMGVGKAASEPQAIEEAARDLSIITGQKPQMQKSKKSISNFRLRKGNIIGCRVTLRNKRMYEFFDRLVSIAIPRIRDFRGLTRKSFDGSGNYTMGLPDQMIFPEIDFDKVKRTQGMDITFVTTGKTDEEASELLELLGMPFKGKE